MKIVTIVGARPQFIKAAAVSPVLRQHAREVLVHTGQHYDYTMSEVFFEDLDVPVPDYHLAVGSGPHGAQTAAMLQRIEDVLMGESPDWVLVYGDTNSTLAGALAAAKLHIRVAHVEAGLRSFDCGMPEEINRRLTDHVATLLLCPSDVAAGNLAAEGITTGVRVVGDVMVDVLHTTLRRINGRSTVLERFKLVPREYLVLTLHRAGISDDAGRVGQVMEAVEQIGRRVLFPVHPRTKRLLDTQAIRPPRNLIVAEPLRYMDMVAATASARAILTDSGGLQKEAYWLGIPCVTLREETEWTETVTNGWNVLAGTDPKRIVAAVFRQAPDARPPLYGDGRAAERCVLELKHA